MCQAHPFGFALTHLFAVTLPQALWCSGFIPPPPGGGSLDGAPPTTRTTRFASTGGQEVVPSSYDVISSLGPGGGWRRFDSPPSCSPRLFGGSNSPTWPWSGAGGTDGGYHHGGGGRGAMSIGGWGRVKSSVRRSRLRLFGGGTGEDPEDASICVIGGGVSGLAAALAAARTQFKNARIVLLESSPTLGGRVQSDRDGVGGGGGGGYVLDRGFAVFIEQYPASTLLLDYDRLELERFAPGALVRTDGGFGRVADPLRQPGELLSALLAPIGTPVDKVRLLPLLVHVFGSTVEDLFDEEETDTASCLRDRYGFSDKFISEFFEPFLEGIYLCPLEKQSSRMFHFVFKMFSEGYVSLPRGGMGAVSDQLAEKVRGAGVDVRTGTAVARLGILEDSDDDDDGDDGDADRDGRGRPRFLVETRVGGDQPGAIRAESVILATDGAAAQRILSTLDGYESLGDLPPQPQRSVGCLYYGFKTSGEKPPPVTDPILILNGAPDRADVSTNPVNNVCFPSVVNRDYAPRGCHLCSATVLGGAMDHYRGREGDLDTAVRKQLSNWFPDHADDILDDGKWELKAIYDISNAQPGQLGGAFPANVNGGRDCSTYRGRGLPPGLFVSGDHMATATLNGALESGMNAGEAAARSI